MTARDTILVVIDDDTEELNSLIRATQMAELFDARIELFSAVFDTYIAGERLFDSSDLVAAKEQRLKEQMEQLEDIARPLRDEGFEVVVDAVWDEPVYEGIVRKVLRSEPQMVIRNKHYHHAIKRSLFSNDDWNLIRTCPAPLLIASTQFADRDKLHVCAAVDPVHSNDKPAELDGVILAAAKDLSTRAYGKLSVLHCYDPAPVIASVAAGSMVPVIADVEGITDQVRSEHLNATMQVLEQYDVPAETIHHIEGNPRTTLPSFAIDQQVDVLVMGAVSRGFIKRTMLGNTAEKVLDKLPCDLLIVKPAGFETPVKLDSPHRIRFDTQRGAVAG